MSNILVTIGLGFIVSNFISKIIKSGWNCKMNFKDSLKNTITWYLKNKSFLN